ncbi:MAG TPA: RidA family protein [Gemmatimonadales bacterium]|nr:RidA family protein [Gemmatimonadales bacterium]
MRIPFLALILLLAPAVGAAQQRQVFNPPGTPTNLPFNNGIKIGNQLWVAGMQGDITGDIESETKTALQKIRSVLQAAGMELRDVVAVQVYLADIKDFQRMNGVYRTFFADPRPTRTTVQVAHLVNDARIEITVTAVKDR